MTTSPDDPMRVLQLRLDVTQQALARLRAEKLQSDMQRIRAEGVASRLRTLLSDLAALVGAPMQEPLQLALTEARHTLASPPPSPFDGDMEVPAEARALAREMTSDVIRALDDALNSAKGERS